MPITLSDHDLRTAGCALVIALKGLPQFRSEARSPAVLAALPQLERDFQVLSHRIENEDLSKLTIGPLVFSDKESRVASTALVMAIKALENNLRRSKRLGKPEIRGLKLDCEALDQRICAQVSLDVEVGH